MFFLLWLRSHNCDPAATLTGKHELLHALQVGVSVTSVQKCMFSQTQRSGEEEEHRLVLLSWRPSENVDDIYSFFQAKRRE